VRDGTRAEETKSPLPPDGLPKSRQQDALRRIEDALDALLQSEPGDTLRFGRDLSRSLVLLNRVFERHVREAEAAKGTLAEVLAQKPHLARKVEQIRAEHVTLKQEIASAQSEVAVQLELTKVDPTGLKKRTSAILAALRRHERTGVNLLYEADFRDEGAH
jgi:hypothetical protein